MTDETAIDIDALDLPAIQLRTQRVLMGSVMAGGAALAAAFSSAAVLAKDITGSDTLAGLAAASLSAGSAIATVPVARRMFRHGRRIGLMTGWTVGGVGAMVAFFAAAFGLPIRLPVPPPETGGFDAIRVDPAPRRTRVSACRTAVRPWLARGQPP